MPVVLIFAVFTAGCLDQLVAPGSDCTLTVEVEGEGEVTPPVGNHRYERDTVVVLNAFPVSGWRFVRWEGEVADPGSNQTTIIMEGDQLVRAVFAKGLLEDPGHPHPSARIHRIWTGECAMTGDSYELERDLWNCSGLEGTWYLRESLTYYGRTSGVISGETTFTMPPRPEEGPWESLPFAFTKSGTTLMTDGSHTVWTDHYEGVVFTLTTSGPFLTMVTYRGQNTYGFVTYSGGHSIQAGPISSDFELGPFLVALVLHPECDPDFPGEPQDDDIPLTPLVPQDD